MVCGWMRYTALPPRLRGRCHPFANWWQGGARTSDCSSRLRVIPNQRAGFRRNLHRHCDCILLKMKIARSVDVGLLFAMTGNSIARQIPICHPDMFVNKFFISYHIHRAYATLFHGPKRLWSKMNFGIAFFLSTVYNSTGFQICAILFTGRIIGRIPPAR